MYWVDWKTILFHHIRYMVDAADHDKVEASRNELHNLLDKPQLAGKFFAINIYSYSCVFLKCMFVRI